jgi:hypothetical protein
LLFAAWFVAVKFHFAGAGSLAVTIGMRAVVIMRVRMGAIHDDDPYEKDENPNASDNDSMAAVVAGLRRQRFGTS